MPSQTFRFKESFDKDVIATKNMVLRLTKKETLPTKSGYQMQYGQNQTVDATINAFFNKLTQNDEIIKQKLQTRNDKLYPPNSDSIVNLFNSNGSVNNPKNKNYYESELKNHIDRLHKNNSFTETINLSSVANDCSNLNLNYKDQQFTLSSEYKDDETTKFSVKNDIVDTFEFETDYPDDTFVVANIYNEFSKYKPVYELPIDGERYINGSLPSIRQVPYILKKWVSGLRDLYVYVATTFTFYNNSNIDECLKKPTILEIKLNKQHFNISDIYDIQINGMSLPLNITDNKMSNYKDIILQSIVRGIPFGGSHLNNVNSLCNDKKYWYLYFIVYGTDAQAIKISYR